MKKIGIVILLFVVGCVSFVKGGYSDEYPSAYNWSYKNGITTQKTIDKANMYGRITRIALAKMISNYAINVLNKKVDTSKKCQFDDISNELNIQYDSGVTKVCQLGLMGQGIKKFRPNDYVTRAEFGTILSRLLYGSKYDGGNPYYKKHLNQLNIRGIMTNISNPEKGNELRGNVMVMLKRSENLGNLDIPSFEELDDAFTTCDVYSVFGEREKYTIDFIKKDFIIPYKDGYFGYLFWGQDGLGFYLTYRESKNPCSIILDSDEIFWWGGDNYLSYSKWNEKAKILNCNVGDYDNCKKEAEKYFYNLIVGAEYNEYFSLWMDALKRKIDNNSYKSEKYYKSGGGVYVSSDGYVYEQIDNDNYYDRSEKFNDCLENFMGKDIDSIEKNSEYFSKLEKGEYSCAIKILKD